MSGHPWLLRVRDGQEARVTSVELFFDLVYVFAVTQLSHHLLEHLTLLGAVQTLVLWLAVWQAWQYTSWGLNWLDPETMPVRLLLFSIMLAGLVMAAVVPEAFGERGLTFAITFVLIQVGRTLAFLVILGRDHALTPNFRRLLGWFSISGVLWIAGGLADGNARLWWWAGAIFCEYFSLVVRFWLPGLGRSETTDWTIEGGHLAERWQLFVIVALGESILVTGATFSHFPHWDAAIIGGFLAAFAGTLAMWWIYFDTSSRDGSAAIAHSADPGRIGAYFLYIHVTLVGGIIVSAVGNELVIAHPHGHVDMKATLVLLLGPAIYLLGNAAYKRIVYGRVPISHAAGLLLLGALAPVAHHTDLLVMGVATTVLLIVVAFWDGYTRPATARPAHARPTSTAASTAASS